MSSPVYRRTCKLPHGFTAEFVIKPGESFECRWAPNAPKGKRARQILPHYKKERDRFLSSLRIPMIVIEL
jgi:hypothetical protein